MQNDILFDNIYIGHSVADAEALAKETFNVKKGVELKEEEATKPEPPKDKPKSPMDLKFFDDPIFYIREKLDLFIAIAQRDPIEAVKFVPEVAGVGAVILAVLIATLLSAVGLGVAKAPNKDEVKAKAQKAKESAVDAKDQVASAVTSSAEQVQSEVNKRTTRSTAQS